MTEREGRFSLRIPRRRPRAVSGNRSWRKRRSALPLCRTADSLLKWETDCAFWNSRWIGKSISFLSQLSASLAQHVGEIRHTFDCLGVADVRVASAKLALDLDMRYPDLVDEPGKTLCKLGPLRFGKRAPSFRVTSRCGRVQL